MFLTDYFVRPFDCPIIYCSSEHLFSLVSHFFFYRTSNFPQIHISTYLFRYLTIFWSRFSMTFCNRNQNPYSVFPPDIRLTEYGFSFQPAARVWWKSRPRSISWIYLIYHQGCGSGSVRIRCFCMDPDPDPVFKFLWIRIRFSNFSGSGSESGFQISLDPDPVFKFSGSGPGSGFSQDSGKLQKGL